MSTSPSRDPLLLRLALRSVRQQKPLSPEAEKLRPTDLIIKAYRSDKLKHWADAFQVIEQMERDLSEINSEIDIGKFGECEDNPGHGHYIAIDYCSNCGANLTEPLKLETADG